MLEAEEHEKRAFVTLTYDNQHLPSDGELVPKHITNFFKRLRKLLTGRKIRYFACGEYGEKSNRPHYHALLFGLDETEADLIARVWPFGSIHVGSVTKESVQYVCGYVLKKNLKKEDGIRTVPEFSRQSLRPGIGAHFPARMASAMSDQDLYPLTMQICGDVPSQVRIGGKMWPIGRYLKNKLRKEVGINEDEIKAVNKALQSEITKEKLKEAEQDPSCKAEIMRLQRSLKKRRLSMDDYKKGVMELYNRTRIERSEKLSQIYQKERVLDNDAKTLQT